MARTARGMEEAGDVRGIALVTSLVAVAMGEDVLIDSVELAGGVWYEELRNNCVAFVRFKMTNGFAPKL